MEEINKEVTDIPIKDIDKIQDICSALVTEVVDGEPGGRQKDSKWLETTRCDYRTLRSLYSKRRTGKRLPKGRLKELEDKEMTFDKVSEDEAFIASELLDALHSTFIYIDKTDPKATRERTGQQDLEYVNIATKANIEFADFFLKVHQKFNLKDEGLYDLFDLLFEKAGITRELEARSLGHFPGGVLAVVRAYLHLSSQLSSGWKFRMPKLELDRDHSVDLVAELKQGKEILETRYYEIKGRKNTESVEVVEITDEPKMEKLRKKIILNTSSNKDRTIKLSSLYKLYDFTKTQRSEGKRVKAFWVEAPSATQ